MRADEPHCGFWYGLTLTRSTRCSRSRSSRKRPFRYDNERASIPLLFQPGERWSYSIAVDLQGYIVERLSGQSFGEFLESRIFKPLKMYDTFFIVPAAKVLRLPAVYSADQKTKHLVEAPVGPRVQDFTKPPPFESAVAASSQPRDYARFCQMVVNGGQLDGVRYFAPASTNPWGPTKSLRQPCPLQ
jgi:CubicO group peptidase (beta-lactamase class C family)